MQVISWEGFMVTSVLTCWIKKKKNVGSCSLSGNPESGRRGRGYTALQ